MNKNNHITKKNDKKYSKYVKEKLKYKKNSKLEINYVKKITTDSQVVLNYQRIIFKKIQLGPVYKL